MSSVGCHRLIHRIARSDTSEVWAGVHHGSEGFVQRVALKTLSDQACHHPLHRRAFIDEARAAARVHHPNVVKVHDLREHRGRLWLSMELISGWTVRRTLDVAGLLHGALPLDIAVAMVCDASAGAHAIHRAGLIHRHLDPDNILLSSAGQAVIIDFGSATLDRRAHLTPPMAPIAPVYSSPQIRHQTHVDLRSDVYSLGCVLYELLVGQQPAQHTERGLPVSRVILAPSLLRPEIPPLLEAVVQRAMDPDPSARFASARELGEALAAVRMHEGWHAPPLAVASYLRSLFDRSEVSGLFDPDRDPIAPSADLDDDAPTGLIDAYIEGHDTDVALAMPPRLAHPRSG